jgi:hypothetical protein
MVGRLRRRKPTGEQPGIPIEDIIDGRPFNPLDPSDGKARIVITAEPVTVDGEEKLKIHVDDFNVRPGKLWEFYRMAERVILHQSKEFMR